ncbi:MAG: serine hydrolase [Candidatus Heimdallarchaeota archaeon]|nr:MAG: serine hydrolase [Candidatus Heimdallarchaeota archaeon]
MKLLKGDFFLVLVILVQFFPYNHYASSTIVKSSSTYDEPVYWPTDGWRTSLPEDQGMSSIKFQEMYEYLDSTVELSIIRASLRSILVIRNGFLIHENYFSSFANENTSINIYSCTKSVTSSVIGIAIEKGFIGGINDNILDYFPDRTIANRDNWKDAIKIEDVLTMRAGFSWDEADYSRPDNDYTLMYASPNPVQYVLDKLMAAAPGSTWVYNTGCSHLLSALIDNRTGIGNKEFTQTYLFDPLGIDRPSWSIDQQNIPYGGSNLRLTPRQMAKFGFLYLHNGSWDGQQLVPKEWVQVSTQPTNTTWWYGYQWWIEPHRNSFSARGYKGQQIIIIPDYNMVVVFTANTNLIGNLYSVLIDDFIIPAIGHVPPSTSKTQTTTNPSSLDLRSETTTTSKVTETSSFISFPIMILIMSTLVLFIRRKAV